MVVVTHLVKVTLSHILRPDDSESQTLGHTGINCLEFKVLKVRRRSVNHASIAMFANLSRMEVNEMSVP